MQDRGAGDQAAVARGYHEATKHSPESVAASRHALDWSNQPLPYKIYLTLEPIPLPTEIRPSTEPAIRALGDAEAPLGPPVPLDLAGIARLCILSNGVIRIRRYPGGELAFRAAGTTGALYHVELYLACSDLTGLSAGIYHFGAHDNGLRRLRAGDYRGALVAATGVDEAIAGAPLAVIATSTFWRNAWKYEARAWRHTFWDGGTVLANLLALADAAGLPARIVTAFADPEITTLLDVDPEREAPVWLTAIGTDAPPPPSPPAPPLRLPTVPLSNREVRYRLIEETQAATSLASGEAAAAWRLRAKQLPSAPEPPVGGPLLALTATPSSALPADPIERVIRRRGSTRRFARHPISADALTLLLEIAGMPLPADFAPKGGRLTELFVIVNAVDGVEPGAYLRRADDVTLELLRAGDFRSQAGWLALGQDLAADAAVNLFWMADLDRLLAHLGGRGYRAAQLDAAVRAGRTWLGAYALRLGATGLTFFDDEVTRFFGSAAEGMAVMFLLAVGRSALAR